MSKSSILSVMIIAILSLTACSSDVELPPNNMVGAEVKADNWNTAIRLIDAPALANSHKNGEQLILRIENLSSNNIIFLDNFGIKVLTFDGKNWIAVPNNSYNTGQYTLPTKKAYPLGLVVIALPYIPNLKSSTKIRVIVVGHVENNDKELLGAFLDVPLNP